MSNRPFAIAAMLLLSVLASSMLVGNAASVLA